MLLSKVPQGVRKWGKSLFVYGKDDEREVTHLCLDGGRLNVPQDREEWFHTKLGIDHARQIRNYVVERRTPIFKFHADIDLFEPEIPNLDDVLLWIRYDMMYVLQQFYPQFKNNDYRELTVLVSTTEIKKGVKKYGKTYDKLGVHLIYPYLLVTKEQSMVLRSAFIQYFKSKYGDRDVEGGFNEWADVFDKTVYCGNGLRMLGCAKTEKCKECKNKSSLKEDCSECEGMGKLDIGRIYYVCNVFNGDGSDNEELMKRLKEDEIDMVKISSIRIQNTTTLDNDIPIMYYPDWFDPKLQFDVVVKHMGGVNSSTGGGSSGGIRVQREDRTRLKDTDIRYKKILEWFRNDELHELFMVPKQYRNAEITEIMMCTPVNEGVFSRYYLIQCNSNYCMNLMEEHSSSGIYFVITAHNGLYQKCFCRCNTLEGRKSGKRCEEFRSESYEIPDDLEYLLFPYEDDNRINNYCGFMNQCNNSLSSIRNERTLIDRLLSEASSFYG